MEVKRRDPTFPVDATGTADVGPGFYFRPRAVARGVRSGFGRGVLVAGMDGPGSGADGTVVSKAS